MSQVVEVCFSSFSNFFVFWFSASESDLLESFYNFWGSKYDGSDNVPIECPKSPQTGESEEYDRVRFSGCTACTARETLA